MSPATKFLAIVVLCILVSCSEAKRGCSSFGHSCYGGHGKRSVVPSITDANNEVEQGAYSAPSRLLKILQQGNDDQYAYPGDNYDSMNRGKDYKIGLLNTIKQLLEESERKQQALHSNQQLNLEDMN